MIFNKPMVSETRTSMETRLNALEQHLNSDVVFVNSEIWDGIENVVKEIVEELKKTAKHDTVYVILTTNGGSAIAVERISNVFRNNYTSVNYIIPDHAYSAGTILSLSGDKIFMDYHGVLGPIDPQVKTKDGKWVSALGYLDKINEMIEKSKKKELTDAEFIILKDFDLGEIRSYEQAKDLSIDILKKFLIKYKFASWILKSDGTAVTDEEKKKKANDIAKKLGDNKEWLSHGRSINREQLIEMGIPIEDINSDKKFKKTIDDYIGYATEYIQVNKYVNFIHGRCFL